jgi:hypothetical protein
LKSVPCRLARRQIAGRQPSDDPDLTVAIHPEPAFRQRNVAPVHGSGGVVPLVRNQPALTFTEEIVPIIGTERQNPLTTD